ncbi:hypothetical protein [Haloplanus rubicundus]|uniref:Uncharacterized protein n=1 Tax=Haloplanus rubicundus TaxID=1547898 RepID=A0A345EHF5_9EURY|nr:hypothetical protein [Haloplanus rubicundus]AXG11627.1 hypothetical protein DU484_18175 [Haloplanus rubicundus]
MNADEPDAPGDAVDGDQEASGEVKDVEVTTVHRKDGVDQITERSVLLDTGEEEIVETFEVVDGEHEYLGDGDPDQRAHDALEARF